MTAESAALGQYAKLNGGERLTSAADLVGVKGTGNIVTLPAQSCGAVDFPNAAVSLCSPSPPAPPAPPAPPSPTPPGECTYLLDTMVSDYEEKEVGASKEDCCTRCQSRKDCGAVAFQNGKCKYAQVTAKHVHTPVSVLCTPKGAELVV